MQSRDYAFQIQIDDIYSCPGTCAGCVLSEEERRGTEPDMSAETLHLTLDRLDAYLKQLRADGNPVKEIQVIYGVGDHLTMPVEYLADLYYRASDIICDGERDPSKSFVYLSTSVIGRPNILGPKLEALAKVEDKVPLVPLVVFDPPKYLNDKLRDRYRENIDLVLKTFKTVDLAANLSSAAIEAMNPTEFYNLIAELGFSSVTLNWTPAQTNIFHTTDDMDAMTDWLIGFDRISQEKQHLIADFSEVFSASIARIRALNDGDDNRLAVADVLDELMHDMVYQSLHVDHNGQLMPKFEAVGDVTYGDRFKFGTLGSLKDHDIKSLLANSLEPMKRRIISIYLGSKACSTCEHMPLCATTGFHVQTKMLKHSMTEDRRCPHVAADLFDYFGGEVTPAMAAE